MLPRTSATASVAFGVSLPNIGQVLDVVVARLMRDNGLRQASATFSRHDRLAPLPSGRAKRIGP
ncbi:MAG: hypothetical protein R3E66_14705 [bacterium]